MFVHFERALEPTQWQYKHFRLLVAIPSPRNIPEVADAIDNHLPQFDIAWFKFFPQSAEPYRKIKSYFLSRKQYTHLALLPDDLVVNEDVYKIVDLAQRWAARPEKTVIAGNCNFEYVNSKLACGPSDNTPYCAFTHNLPALQRDKRVFDWYTMHETLKFKKQPVKVLHSGTPFTIIRRDIMELVSFDTDYMWNRQHGPIGTSEDVVLSHDLSRLKIPVYVHTGTFFKHLRGLKEAQLVNI